MPKIRIDEDQLRSRGSQFSSLLEPLRGKRRGSIAWEQQALPNSRVKLAARDTKLNPDIDSWRFATYLRDFPAAYQEVWASDDPMRQHFWYLEKAYLHIYRTNRVARSSEEFVFLHADPEVPDSDTNAKYRQSPHLHIKAAPDPIGRAHITLAHGYLESILSSESNLFDAMKLGIELIRDEILELYVNSATIQ